MFTDAMLEAINSGKRYKCEIFAVKSAAIRTKTIRGTCCRLPQKGERFFAEAAPLDEEADVRLFVTSEVKKVEQNGNVYTLHTESGSIYRVTIENEKMEDVWG